MVYRITGGYIYGNVDLWWKLIYSNQTSNWFYSFGVERFFGINTKKSDKIDENRDEGWEKRKTIEIEGIYGNKNQTKKQGAMWKWKKGKDKKKYKRIN
jgi:hypothetical protein